MRRGPVKPDLLVWSDQRVVLYKKGAEAATATGLETLTGVRDIAVGDYDNDGLPDLAVLTAKGVTLFHNDHGKFIKGERSAAHQRRDGRTVGGLRPRQRSGLAVVRKEVAAYAE